MSNFPRIETINDVLPYVEGRDEFKVSDKGSYIVIDYQYQQDGTFDPPQARECRGIVFNPDGTIQARRLHKFFNQGENLELEQEFFDDNFRMFEKLDGSLITPILSEGTYVDGKWVKNVRLATKAGVTDVSRQCESEIKPSVEFLQKCQFLLETGFTPIFEYTSPNNRIVVKYDEPRLTLIAVRENVTGEYQHLDDYAEWLGVDRVKEIHEPLSSVRDWQDSEGVVLVWDNGYRLKVKADHYVIQHRLKDSLQHEKNVLAMVLDDSVDDLAGVLEPEDFRRVKEYNHNVWSSVVKVAKTLSSALEEVRLIEDRKGQALRIKELWSRTDPQMVPLSFSVIDGKPALDAVVDHMKKNLKSQSSVDSMRNLIGTKWEY